MAYRSEYLASYKRINHEVWRSFERGEITSLELRRIRFQRFCDEVGIDTNPESMSARYLEWLGRSAFLLDGASEVVEKLAAYCRLAIVTNGLKDVQNGRFGLSPIKHHFDAIVISEEVGAQKPDPRIFEHAMERLGKPDRRSVLMVGDSLSSDIQGGVNFGIDTCWFNPAGEPAPGRPAPRHIVRRLDELLPLCLTDGAGEGPAG